ncbi:hypothetical protein [Pseudonocardia humida]|uniref:SCO6045-like C-terminal domain-containing protein n=1 Tax=Pseudonocardia humida TaxID=2800819 RepID=A0ABT0ZVL7_9PSEU|nr:hypothetical protein [Pseudonocardia humida]MCO1654789.1 hypothetical protein [Pseudonocardia humida]
MSAGLAARQAELVAALVAGGPLPAGFDAVRVEAARRALLRKRAGEAAKAWPVLAAALGPDWVPAFAADRAGTEPAGGLRDGWDLARNLRRRAELPGAAAVELAAREAELRYDGRSAPRPRALAPLRRTISGLRRRR